MPLLFSTLFSPRPQIFVQGTDNDLHDLKGIRGNVLTATVVTGNGYVRLGSASGVHVESCSNSSGTSFKAPCLTSRYGGGTVFASELKFAGSLQSLRALFSAHLIYQGKENFNGNDRLSIIVDDNGTTGSGGNEKASLSLDVSVSADNDLPMLIFGERTFITAEDTAVQLINVSVLDPETETTSISHKHAGKLK